MAHIQSIAGPDAEEKSIFDRNRTAEESRERKPVFPLISRAIRWDLMVLSFLLYLCSTLPGCTTSTSHAVPENWQRIEAGKAFTFHAPPDLKPVEVQGIDSFVGQYESPTLTLSFDYGWYSDPMDSEEYVRSPTEIDGRQAFIARKENVMGVYFPEVEGNNKLNMYAELNGADSAMVEMIFRSIDFP